MRGGGVQYKGLGGRKLGVDRGVGLVDRDREGRVYSGWRVAVGEGRA